MKFLHQITSASIAAFLVIAVLAAYSGFTKFINRPDSFMTVHVVVPDHKQGEDPEIIYERNIKRAASGVWVVEANCKQNEGNCDSQPKCSGSGAHSYKPVEAGITRPQLSYYIGQKCILDPGVYKLSTWWNLTDSAGNTATVTHETKPFTVSPN